MDHQSIPEDILCHCYVGHGYPSQKIQKMAVIMQCIGYLHFAYMYVSSVMIQFYCKQRVGRFAKFIVFASHFAVFQYREATIM